MNILFLKVFMCILDVLILLLRREAGRGGGTAEENAKIQWHLEDCERTRLKIVRGET